MQAGKKNKHLNAGYREKNAEQVRLNQKYSQKMVAKIRSQNFSSQKFSGQNTLKKTRTVQKQG